MNELLAKQAKQKYFDQVKSKKYKLFVGREAECEKKMQEELDKLRSIGAVVNKLIEDNPDLQTRFRKIDMSVQNRLNQEQLSLEELFKMEQAGAAAAGN